MMMIDLHNHLLPDLDDGSRSLAETLHHMERLGRAGAVLLVLTPHLLVDRLSDAGIDAELARHGDAFAGVVAALDGVAGLPGVQRGQEILAPTPAELARVVDRPAVGLGQSGALLIELGFQRGYDAAGVIAVARAAGRTPVLAHVERYAFEEGEDPVDTVRRWGDMGAVLQVNVGSLLGRYTPEANALSWRLVTNGAAHVVASDHHGDSRAHEPALALPLLERRVGPGAARRLLSGNPRRLLQDEGVLDVVADPGSEAAAA